ncbi:hypothetical protein BpJC7_23780 [Weizmannia acidilactici]|uniref:Core domain-containing protein n=1 Tax=Weizmannia acidilactici TaxID=2607726 RepID=A0A5J4JK63_9BACI|nr:iron-sulfur cluster biosynthesis family protein [Weizmannia acidilactici]GER68237.1 hypothetical protein BpJC4_27080 [Weizmannia acidilactici]GER71075.1 hypothetical protein BpJC7_23780 [Weizmannia acidilactici]GER74542.1 hypothetical protein BpPP18_26090 [Weizmannia acidilactici]
MISITDAAIAYLEGEAPQKEAVLRLLYDSEGCGCGTDGVPVLMLTDKDHLEKSEQMMETNGMPVAIEKSDLIYFGGDLTIDYAPESNTFVLKSSDEILGRNVPLIKPLKQQE